MARPLAMAALNVGSFSLCFFSTFSVLRSRYTYNDEVYTQFTQSGSGAFERYEEARGTDICGLYTSDWRQSTASTS